MAMQFRELVPKERFWSSRSGGHWIIRRHNAFGNEMSWAWCLPCAKSCWIYTNTNAKADAHVASAAGVRQGDLPAPEEALRVSKVRFENDLREAFAYASEVGGAEIPFRMGREPEHLAATDRPEGWDYRRCVSLFGYAFIVHLESGAVCQYCGLGRGDRPSFEVWRQLAIEHVIEQNAGGRLCDIASAIEDAFAGFGPNQLHGLIELIHAENTISACALCNSFASHVDRKIGFDDTGPTSLGDLIRSHRGDPSGMVAAVRQAIARRRTHKAEQCGPKALEVKRAFEGVFLPGLAAFRERGTE